MEKEYDAQMEYKKLCEVAEEAARVAGAEIMRHFGTTESDTKSDNSPVSIADRAAHNVLMELLLPTQIPILSEEAEPEAHTDGRPRWIIDPLDGTRDFLQQTDDFSVMIGLIDRGVPVLGVVFMPRTNTLYYGMKDGGAFLVDASGTRPLSPSTRTIDEARFICSKNHFDTLMQDVIDTLHITEKIPRGSVGVKAGVIAEGGGEFYFSPGKFGEWDVCAPHAIAVAAGCTVTDLEGNALYYANPDNRIQKGVLIATNTCHKPVLDAVIASQAKGV